MRQPHHKTFIAHVDSHRRPSRCHNTKGSYLIGAKNEKQARKLLQAKIGFGSIYIYGISDEISVPYKTVVKKIRTIRDNKSCWTQVPVIHDTAAQPNN